MEDTLMAMRISAAVLRQVGGPIHIESLHLDDPEADEVLVRIVASESARPTHMCARAMFQRRRPSFWAMKVLGWWKGWNCRSIRLGWRSRRALLPQLRPLRELL